MNIEPIRLLRGHQENTATTGQGCFMNVVSYLNGDAQITDRSPCVCVTVRPLSIRLNDLGNDEQRLRLLPFVLRAMGSATENTEVLAARRARLCQYGEECNEVMQSFLKSAKSPSAGTHFYLFPDASTDAYAIAKANCRTISRWCAAADATFAEVNSYAVAYSNAHAYARSYIESTHLQSLLFDAGLRFLDDVLPAAESASLVVAERCETLVKMQAA